MLTITEFHSAAVIILYELREPVAKARVVSQTIAFGDMKQEKFNTSMYTAKAEQR